MSVLELVPLRHHKARHALHGLIPLQRTMMWEPVCTDVGHPLTPPRLPHGMKYLAIAGDPEVIHAQFEHRGFLNTGTQLDDGRSVFVWRQQAA